MAKYNEILVGRFNRGLQKLFGMKGGVPAPQLSSEFQPNVQFPLGVEFRYLESWERFQIAMNRAALAANAGSIQARNPVGSNMIAVFEKMLVTNVAGATDFPTLTLLAKTTDLATVVSPVNIRLDPRGRTNPTLILSSASPGPAPVQNILQISLPVATNLDVILIEDQQIPLLPGDAIVYSSGIVNQRIDVTWQWRERFLEEGERT